MKINEISFETLIAKYNSIGISAHDAGGSNLLASMIENFPHVNFYLFTEGPASNIFRSKNTTRISDKSNFLKKIDLLISGTGGTSFEKEVLYEAKKSNVMSVSVLDHFVNFKQRFIFNNDIVLPDLCFVCDLHAYSIAKNDLKPFDQIYICENYYINSIKSKIKVNTENNILYVLENPSEDWGGETTWKILFDNFYLNFYKKSNKLGRIIVRPHPKDDPSIYEELKSYKEVVFDNHISIKKSLSSVSIIVGAESYILYIGSEIGYDVYTSIPSFIRKPRLPDCSYKFIV